MAVVEPEVVPMSVQEFVTLGPSRSGSDRLARRLAESAAWRDSIVEVEGWLASWRARRALAVEKVPLDQLVSWHFDTCTGDLVHDTGRFFAVRGLDVRTDYGHVHEWTQPILHQPEGGILGFLARQLDGVLHFLVQLKVEPGNVSGVQLAPTVQATPSNYRRAHRGAAVPHLGHFLDGRARVLVDVLQSEQGAWFYGKRNRNMVLEVDHDVDHDDSFAWLTLGQIYELLRRPNTMNMDSRAVLSCLPLPIGSGDHPPSASRFDIRGWLTSRKAHYELTSTLVPLRSVDGWRRDAGEIRHPSGRYFSIMGAMVSGTSREVPSWCQPLLRPCGDGLVAFVVRWMDDTLWVLARADVRPGYRDTVEVGPTVQCTSRNFVDQPEIRPDFLDLVLSPDVKVHYDVDQSEEGGRFFHAVTRHLIVEVDDGFPVATPPDYCWATPVELEALLDSSYQLNVEARSLLVCLQALCR